MQQIGEAGGSGGVPGRVGGSQGGSLGRFENCHFLVCGGELVNDLMKY